jgi:hypothetical protein
VEPIPELRHHRRDAVAMIRLTYPAATQIETGRCTDGQDTFGRRRDRLGCIDFGGREPGRRGRRRPAPIRRVRGITAMQVGFSDSLGVIRYEWWVDGELVQSHSQNSGSSSSVAVLTYDFGTTARTASVEVRAWDLAGNPAARTYELIVDVAGPTVTSVTPANGTFVRGSGITSTVRATDPAGIIGASLDASWVTDPKNLTIAVSAGADGRKTLTWRVHDKVHNVTTVGCTVIVDNTRPGLKVTKAPKSGAKVSGTVKVTASATDRNGVSKVELLINGKVVARDVKAGYGFAIKTKKYGKKIRFQLRAYDRAGKRHHHHHPDLAPLGLANRRRLPHSTNQGFNSVTAQCVPVATNAHAAASNRLQAAMVLAGGGRRNQVARLPLAAGRFHPVVAQACKGSLRC